MVRIDRASVRGNWHQDSQRAGLRLLTLGTREAKARCSDGDIEWSVSGTTGNFSWSDLPPGGWPGMDAKFPDIGPAPSMLERPGARKPRVHHSGAGMPAPSSSQFRQGFAVGPAWDRGHPSLALWHPIPGYCLRGFVIRRYACAAKPEPGGGRCGESRDRWSRPARSRRWGRRGNRQRWSRN